MDEKEVENKVEEIEDKKKKKTSMFSNVPTYVIVLVMGGIFFLLMTVRNKGEGTDMTVPFAGIVILILIVYFWSQKDQATGTRLTPREARALIMDELKYYRQLGVVDRTQVVKVTMYGAPQFVDGNVMHYNFGMEVTHPNCSKSYGRAQVNSYTGDVMFQESPGKITGRETRDVVNILPKWFKEGEKMEKTISKFAKRL